MIKATTISALASAKTKLYLSRDVLLNSAERFALRSYIAELKRKTERMPAGYIIRNRSRFAVELIADYQET